MTDGEKITKRNLDKEPLTDAERALQEKAIADEADETELIERIFGKEVGGVALNDTVAYPRDTTDYLRRNPDDDDGDRKYSYSSRPIDW